MRRSSFLVDAGLVTLLAPAGLTCVPAADSGDCGPGTHWDGTGCVAGEADTDSDVADTWVRATIDGQVYERAPAEGVLHTYWRPNHLQMFGEGELNAVLFGWRDEGVQSWSFFPIVDNESSGMFWWPAGGVQWWSISGTFEITRFEDNPDHGASDDRMGWIEGTFDAQLREVLDPGGTIAIDDGAFRALIHGIEGE